MATGRVLKRDATSEIAIFARLIKTDQTDLSRDLARYILTLGLDAEDQNWMSELAQQNPVIRAEDSRATRLPEEQKRQTDRCAPCFVRPAN